MDFANANTERNGTFMDPSGLIKHFQNLQLDWVLPAIMKNANQIIDLESITIQEHTTCIGIIEPSLDITTSVLD